MNPNLTYQSYTETAVEDFGVDTLLNQFKEKQTVDLVINLNINIKESVSNIISNLRSLFSINSLDILSPSKFVIQNKTLFMVCNIDKVNNPFGIINRKIDITIFGLVFDVEQIYRKIEEIYILTNKENFVYWFFKGSNGLQSSSFPLENHYNLKNEYYPFIPNVNEYVDSFLNSTENILIFLGPPGTGKTSLLRNMLTRGDGCCYVTYDDIVMQDDQLYVNFLSNSDANFLVLEDADLLLKDRLHDNNRVMSKILNAADGLVSFENKKMIFTANINDIRQIDEALRRPGRCFDIVKFRSLTYNESLKVAELNNITLGTTPREYSLAEIFKQKT